MSDYEKHSNNCEAIPIKVNRVFDSCSDKDCVKGVQVVLSESLPKDATIVKNKCITVSNVCMNVEPIPFNKGFYSVDITFTLDIQLLVYSSSCCAPTEISGTASVSKNCVLFGSETNSKTFTSDGSVVGYTGNCYNIINPPKAVVQVVSPLVLEAVITNNCPRCECSCTSEYTSQKGVSLTIGLFYVVELTRPVTVMVPAYNYTIPTKECCSNSDTPCEIFDKIQFPVEEFSPVNLENNCCGCSVPTDVRLTTDNCPCQNDEY